MQQPGLFSKSMYCMITGKPLVVTDISAAVVAVSPDQSAGAEVFTKESV